jgi:uncharacterized protein
MKKLAADSYRAMPWKNGGGTTTEILRFPEGASLDAFEWRISMARIDASGPFSHFPNVDRSLLILEGDGVVLTMAKQGSVRLDRESSPFAFPGDVDVEARLDAPIEDFNVMTRRGRFRHGLSRARVETTTRLAATADILVVVLASGSASARLGDSVVPLAARDALLIRLGEPDVELIPGPGAEILRVELFAIAG